MGGYSLEMVTLADAPCCRVFYKQRNNKFFPVSTYAYAMAFSHVSFQTCLS